MKRVLCLSASLLLAGCSGNARSVVAQTEPPPVTNQAPAPAGSPPGGGSQNANPMVLTGNLGIHDPSTIIKRNGIYHVWGTGDQIYHLTSTDLITWKAAPPVFPAGTWPKWIDKYVPGFKGTFWAPDCISMNGQYYLYYSCSMGKRECAIGLASSPDLSTWTDQGMVIYSDNVTPYGSIDPAVVQGAAGNLWMPFGSHLKGIWLVQLNPATGKRLNAKLYNVATDPDAEAAYVTRHGDYYYLFYNVGICCAGMGSTYHIMMGRSKTISGPYLDKDGKDLAQGGGTPFLSTDTEVIGPGHAGILHEGGTDYVSFHYYNGLANGAPTLGLKTLGWSADGWPQAGDLPGSRPTVISKAGSGLPGGRYAIVSKTSGLALGVRNRAFTDGTEIDQFAYDNSPFQQWNLVPTEDGYYGIGSLGTGKYMDLFECSPKDGTKISEYPWFGNDCQKWRIEQTSDGAYRIISKGGGSAITLPGGTKTPQAVVQGYAWKGDSGQQWLFKKLP